MFSSLVLLYRTRSPARKRRASSVDGDVKNCGDAPRSTMRPPARNTTSPASRLAWPRSCVAMTILTPSAAVRVTMSSTRLGRGGVEAGGRLVEEEHLGRAGKRARESKALLLAARETTGGTVGQCCQPDLREQLSYRCRIGCATRCRQRESDIGCRSSPQHHRLLEHDGAARCARRRTPAEGDASGAWRNEAHAKLDERRLARAVGTEQHGGRAAGDLERHVVQDI